MLTRNEEQIVNKYFDGKDEITARLIKRMPKSEINPEDLDNILNRDPETETFDVYTKELVQVHKEDIVKCEAISSNNGQSDPDYLFTQLLNGQWMILRTTVKPEAANTYLKAVVGPNLTSTLKPLVDEVAKEARSAI